MVIQYWVMVGRVAGLHWGDRLADIHLSLQERSIEARERERERARSRIQRWRRRRFLFHRMDVYSTDGNTATAGAVSGEREKFPLLMIIKHPPINI